MRDAFARAVPTLERIAHERSDAHHVEDARRLLVRFYMQQTTKKGDART